MDPANWAPGLLVCALLGLIPACSGPERSEWQEHGAYRVRPLLTIDGRGDGFTSFSSRIPFVNTLSDSAFLRNRHLVNGSGVAVGDVNGDGWPDILFAALEGASTLYLNNGDWQFEDVTVSAGLSGINANAMGAAMADVDGDGHLDVLVTSLGGGIQLFVNDGRGQFRNATSGSGMATEGGATTVTLADIDGDHDLDLYVGFYKVATVKDLYPPDEIVFERVVRQQADSFFVDPSMAMHYRLIRQGNRLMRVEVAEPDQLYINEGEGIFARVDWTGGTFLDENGKALTEQPRDWALTARFQDLNGDNRPDLYVCNDFESPDHIWLGDGAGTLRAMPTRDIRQTSQSTMSIAAGDIDADGYTDVFLADMLSRSYLRRQRQHQVIPPEATRLGDIFTRPQIMQNMLLRARGDGSFAETARWAGVDATEWTWSSEFFDVDLDGYQDLVLTTGHAYDAMDADAQMQAQRSRRYWRELLLDFPDLDLPNMVFRNQGDGTFAMQPDGWGLGEEHDVSHGMATGDLDLDGDLDVVINRLNSRAGLFRNDATASRISVQLRGSKGNAYGVGAKVQVDAPDAPLQVREVVAGGNYLSSSEPRLSFAWFQGARLKVLWPGGEVSEINEVLPDHHYEVFESHAQPAESALVAASPMFVAEELHLAHYEQEYADFDRQPLLPRRLSQRGPGVAIADVDGNGFEDIVLGSGKGGYLQFALNFGGRFGRAQELGELAKGDHAGILVQSARNGSSSQILVAVSNYEHLPTSNTDSSFVARVSYDLGDLEQRIPLSLDSPGPLVRADFTGDQELDLFVGGHFQPGRYPAAASSHILRGQSGLLQYDAELSAPFADIGRISGATATDLNQDGLADLVLADELGPIRVFVNRGGGQMAEMTRSSGLDQFVGWWNGVATGDFDADGRLDLIATNRGLNAAVPSTEPVRLYYSDLDRNGTLDILEARAVPELGGFGLIRDLPTLLNAIPPMAQRVQSYEHFASLSVDELLGEMAPGISYIDVATSETTVFLNRGQSFEVVTLDPSAQLTTAFAVVVADFDGDGAEDAFLSQNDFALPPSVPRMDSGLGQLLLGGNSGLLTPVPPAEAGIRVFGAQRGAAAGDLNLDGRTDLVVTQNANPTKLYFNQTAAVGLTVRLSGPPGNAEGIGASIRVEYTDGSFGPARFVSAGDGYWSQSSPTQVLGLNGDPAQVHVRWPGGALSAVPVADRAKRVNIDFARSAQVN